MRVNVVDNSEKAIEEFEAACLRALERCGLQAEGYAKDLSPVDTGNLKNSITHRVDDSAKACYVGTNIEYAPYVELGTGPYAEGGGGTAKPSWVYQDELGNWHRAYPQKPQPFIKPAVADHKQTYQNIIKDELENA